MTGLEYALRANRVPQTELANLLGIKKQNLTLWLKGKQPISKKHLPTLSKFFGVSPETIQKEIEPEDELAINISNIKRLAGSLGLECDINVNKRDVL